MNEPKPNRVTPTICADIALVALSDKSFRIMHIGRARPPVVLAATLPMTHAAAWDMIQKFRDQLDAMERALGPILPEETCSQ